MTGEKPQQMLNTMQDLILLFQRLARNNYFIADGTKAHLWVCFVGDVTPFLNMTASATITYLLFQGEYTTASNSTLVVL